MIRAYHPAEFGGEAFINHAHNDYLQWLVEGGAPAAVLMLVFAAVYLLQWRKAWTVRAQLAHAARDAGGRRGGRTRGRRLVRRCLHRGRRGRRGGTIRSRELREVDWTGIGGLEGLPSRDLVLEFDLEEGEVPGRMKAVNVVAVG